MGLGICVEHKAVKLIRIGNIKKLNTGFVEVIRTALFFGKIHTLHVA